MCRQRHVFGFEPIPAVIVDASGSVYLKHKGGDWYRRYGRGMDKCVLKKVGPAFGKLLDHHLAKPF